MSAADDLLLELAVRGVTLSRDGEALVASPPGSVTPELADRLRAAKSQLLDLVGDWPDRPAAWRLLEATDAGLERRGLRGDPRAVAIAALCADAFAAHDLPEMRRLCGLALALEPGVTDSPATWPEDATATPAGAVPTHVPPPPPRSMPRVAVPTNDLFTEP